MQVRRQVAAIALAGGLVTAGVVGVGAATVGQESQARQGELRIATADIFRVVRLSMASEDLAEAREQKEAEFVRQLEELQSRLEQHRTKLQNLAPGDPEMAPTQAAFQADAQEMQRMQQQMQVDFGEFTAQQGAEAYMRAHEAATELANERGYTHLFASSLGLGSLRGEAGFEIQNMTQLSQEVLARPVLMAPEGDDLTRALIEKLDLTEEAEQEAERAAELRGGQPLLPGGGDAGGGAGGAGGAGGGGG